MTNIKLFFKNIVPYCFILFAFLYVTFPLLHKGFFPTFDDVQVVRIDEMAKEIMHGQFPVRYANNLGNGGGYMIFNFYSPLVYYVGAVIHTLGISLVKSTKLVFLMGYFLGAIGTFFILKKEVSRISATIGSLLLLFSPYLSYEAYTRGTLAEFFGMTLLPFFIGFTFFLKEKPSIQKSIILGVMLALLVYAHSFIAVNAVIIAVVIFLFPPYHKKQSIYAIASLFIGVLLSASFWLPVLVEQQYTKYAISYFGSNAYKTNFLSVLQLTGFEKIPWGFRPPILGIAITLGVMMSLLGSVYSKKKRTIIISGSLAFFVCLFLASNMSTVLWNNSNFLKLLQFPWRFLAGATVIGVFTICFFINQLPKKLAFILGGILVLLSLTNYGYFRPTNYNYIAIYTADDICSSTTWGQEYLPRWGSTCLPKPKKEIIPLIRGNASNIQEKEYGREITFLTANSQKSTVVIRRYYFPGWYASVDGKEIASFPSTKYGLISIVIPSGRHRVTLTWRGTVIEQVANWITLSSGVALVGFIIILYSKRKKLL